MKYNSAAVFHSNGQFMFYCDLRRANWYLKKNLAIVRTETPERLEIILQFEPKGMGPGDEFSSHAIINHCVVCASVNDLTKHHIVPSCYRKFFPKEYKARINHDVVIVCENHHHVYEDFANILKEQLAEKYHIPTLQQCSELQGHSSNPLLKKYNVVKSLIKTYFDHKKNGHVSPNLVEKMKIIGIDVEKDDLMKILEETEKQFRIIADLSVNIDHGQLMVSKIDDIDKFVKTWRQHFVETMKPQYMPQGWSIGYKTKQELLK